MAEEKKKNPLQEITQKLEQGVKDVYSSDRYKQYLKVMSKFHRYSFSNSILIMIQNPDATLVAGYKRWQTLKRQVKKGEKGISILAPAPYKKVVEEEVEDPATGEKNVVEKEITLQRFRVVKVFDISQTVGEPLPSIGEELVGNVENYPLLFKSIEAISPAPVKIEDFHGRALGYFSPLDWEIVIKPGMSEMQNVKTLIHEVAHALLHGKEDEPGQSRRVEEVEAESIAFIVCNHLGIDTSTYSFDYLAAWSSGKELDELKQSLGTIQKTASQLITSISEKYRDLCKEQKEKLVEEMLDTVRHDGEIDLDREKRPPISDRIVAAQETAEEREEERAVAGSSYFRPRYEREVR